MTFRVRNIVEELAAELHRLHELEDDQKPNVLVVEDNSEDSGLMRYALEDICTVNLAETGEKAIELIKESLSPDARDFQIVFLDLNLPGMSGMEVFREIRKLVPKVHVAIVTGFPMTEAMLEEAMSLGYFGLIKKPLTKIDAKEIVSKHAICRPPPKEGNNLYLLHQDC